MASISSSTISSSVYISNGQLAYRNTIIYGGRLSVSSGGTANETTVNSYGHMYVDSGGTANETTVNVGYLRVCGGTATGIIVSNGGALGITVAPNTYIQGVSAGSAFLMENAFISGYTVNSGGGMYISSGGTANETTVNSGGWLEVWSGGTANATTVNSGGYLYVSSGGTANATTVNSWGSMSVSSGGTANETTVNSDGYLHVSSGGTATEIVENGGYVYFWDDANVTFVPNTFSGLILGYLDSATVHSGTTANATTLNSGGWMYVSSGGTANSTTVNSSGHLWVTSGGTANSTTLNSGGWMNVSSGGTALQVKENGGYVYVAQGANVTFTPNTFSGLVLSTYQSATVHSGTTANETTVNSEGYLYVWSGGTATGIIVSNGGALGITVAPNTYIQGVSAGSAFLMENAFISGYTVYDGDLSVSSGGTANSTTVNGDGNNYVWGVMYVSSGGTANSTTVNSGGRLWVSSGGTANSTTVNSGGWLDVEGGTATGIIVSNGGGLGITVAPNTYIQGTSAGSAFLMENAFISGYTVNGGYLSVSSGGTANSTTLNSGGWMNVSSGGTANSTTVSGGRLYVTSGGTANSTTLNSGGWMNVSSGGTANETTVNDYGQLNVYSGGTATEIVENGGYVYFWDDANVTFVPNTFSGLILGYLDSATVHSGTTANSTTVNTYGQLNVFSGGTANRTTVNSGGRLYVHRGGKLTGSLEIASGAIVSAYQGSIIDFDISSVESGSPALIDDLSKINGTPDFTITVSAEQSTGTYILANGAEGFDQAITVYCDTAEIGSLSVGETIIDNDRRYSLAEDSGTLSFTVTQSPVLDMEFFTGHFTGAGTAYNNVAVYMPNKDGLVKVMYPNGGETFAVTDLGAAGEPWKMIGVGDFNGDHISDVLWRNMSIGDVGSWLGNGSFGVTWQHMAGASVGEWEIVGVGDFNADATDDVLWYNTETGLMLNWQVQNGVYSADAIIAGAAPGEWKFAGVGDFNGDGTDDILWHNQISGAGGYWALQNGTYSAWHDLAGADPKEWTMIGIGDFDANGYDDVLWLNNDTGLVGCWANSNSGEVEWNTLAGAGDLGGWHYSGVGDFDSDGRADVLWAHDSGSIGAWITDKDRIAVNSWMVIA